MRAKLRCQVSPGLFSSEFSVVVRSSAGREFSLFSDRGTVTVGQQPGEDRPVDGWIEVDVVEEQGSLVVVRLPQSTLENGPYLTVNRSQLDVRGTASTTPAV